MQVQDHRWTIVIKVRPIPGWLVLLPSQDLDIAEGPKCMHSSALICHNPSTSTTSCRSMSELIVTFSSVASTAIVTSRPRLTRC